MHCNVLVQKSDGIILTCSAPPVRKFDFPQWELQCKYHSSTHPKYPVYNTELTNTAFNSRQMLNSDLTNTDNSGLDKYWQLLPKSYNCPHGPSLCTVCRDWPLNPGRLSTAFPPKIGTTSTKGYIFPILIFPHGSVMSVNRHYYAL